jgi:hypothetical protein
MVAAFYGRKPVNPQRRPRQTDNASSPFQQRKIFVGGLAHGTMTVDLNTYFGRFGRITDAVVLRWPDGNSRGFGYVTFAEEATTSAVLQCQHVIDGQQVEVKRAVPTTNKLFVGRLPPQTTDTDLHQYFEAFGTVSSAVVMMDSMTGRTRGFGFVCFQPGQEGKAAMDATLSQKHRIHRKWIDAKSAASYQEMASSKDKDSTATSDSGDRRTPSENGDSSSENMSSSGATECVSSASGSEKTRSCRHSSVDLGEPQKVLVLRASGGAEWPPAYVKEPVGVDLLSFQVDDLLYEKRRLHVDTPAKVQTSLLSAMPGVVIPSATAPAIANAKAPPLQKASAARPLTRLSGAFMTGDGVGLVSSDTWRGSADHGRAVFAASEDFTRSLESLLKLEAARCDARTHGNQLAQHMAGELMREIGGQQCTTQPER